MTQSAVVPYEELFGTLEKIIFKSDEGFVVAALKLNARESVIIRGSLPSVHDGEHVSLKGNWTNHPKFGRQFEVRQCVAQLPKSVEGIRKYLASGLIKGIGPKYASRLVDEFGAQTLDIIDTQPHRLASVEGIGPKRLEQIVQAWSEQKEISRVMVFLQERDVSTSFAVKIFKKYGQESIAKITENPYRLAEDIWGVGFKMCDTLALKLGFAASSSARFAAGILHAIAQDASQGHLYVELERVKELVHDLLGVATLSETTGIIKYALHDLFERKKILLITHESLHYITLPQYYYSEKGIAQKIQRLHAIGNARLQKDDYGKAYEIVRAVSEHGFALNENQQQGIMHALQSKVTIITGGPGTGKTTTIRRLLDVFDALKLKFRLAAPTGRAAKRMFEGTGRNAETLHRLLEFSPATMNFTRNEQNALELDVLVVDEASMIDVFLMHAIMRALPERAQLILIGDIDQLPSVGAGNILGDLIRSGVVTTVRLTEIFRQAQDSMIIVNAHRINNGEFPKSAPEGARDDFRYVKETEPERTAAFLHKIYSKVLPARGISVNDAVVLCPMNKGGAGTVRLNHELQQILNPSTNVEHEVTRFGAIYRVRDRVMQVRNNYDKFVFNGDIGYISAIDREAQQLKIVFNERELLYDFSELDEIMLAYAISIHKSQGSEFRAVIIPIFMQHFIMLQRNLIYTALTRAKHLCIFIGDPKAISMGIRNNKGLVRKTFLKEFLTSDLVAR